MDDARTSPDQPSPPRAPRGRRLRLAMVAALLLAVGGGVILKFLLGPALLRRGLRQQVGRVWQGGLDIGETDFALSAPQRVWRDLTLLDEQGRAWLRVDRLAFSRDTRDNSPGGWRVAVDGPHVTYRLGQRPPLRAPDGAGLSRDAFYALELRDLALHVESTPPTTPDALEVPDNAGAAAASAASAAPPFALDLAGWGATAAWPEWSPGPMISAVDAAGASSALALILPDGPRFTLASLALESVDLEAAGRPLTLRHVQLADLRVHDGIASLGQGRFELDGAVLSLRGSTELERGGFELGISIEDADFGQLAALLGRDWPLAGVCRRAEINLVGLAGAEASPAGSIWLHCRKLKFDAGLLGDVANALQIQPVGDEFSLTARLELAWPLLKIQSARLSGEGVSVAVQSGSIDLATHHVDAYLVMGLLQRQGEAGLVGKVARSLSTLTRVRVEGPWDAPPAELLSKQPIQDTARAMGQFLGGLAEVGAGAVGGLGRKAVGGVAGLLNGDKEPDAPDDVVPAARESETDKPQ